MKKKMVWLFFVFLIVSFVGCEKEATLQAGDEGTYLIYYVAGDNSGLVSEVYLPSATEKTELVRELLEKLTLGFSTFEESSARAADTNGLDDGAWNTGSDAGATASATKKPEEMEYNKIKATIKDFSFTVEDRLLINFSSDYYNEKGLREILGRACIVKTLTQVEDIEFIEFTVSGQPLVDANEKLVGLMTKDDFIDDIEMETSYTITVYYANEDGTALKELNKVIYDSGSVSMEQIVIKQLISGTTEEGYYNTIPEGTTLLKVTTKDGICYVDFNQNFMNKLSSITDQVALYSVVNTLVELPNVNKVQFLINGETKKTFSEGAVFDGFFERNLDLIEGTK